jgi:TPR repeat protein
MNREVLSAIVPEFLKQAGMEETSSDYFDFGMHYITGGMEKGEAKALEIGHYCLEKAAEMDHVLAQAMLATMLQTNMFGRDFVMSEFWAKKAVDAGNAQGMSAMAGVCFHKDDYDGNEMWLKKAIAAGDPNAQLALDETIKFRRMMGK